MTNSNSYDFYNDGQSHRLYIHNFQAEQVLCTVVSNGYEDADLDYQPYKNHSSDNSSYTNHNLKLLCKLFLINLLYALSLSTRPQSNPRVTGNDVLIQQHIFRYNPVYLQDKSSTINFHIKSTALLHREYCTIYIYSSQIRPIKHRYYLSSIILIGANCKTSPLFIQYYLFLFIILVSSSPVSRSIKRVKRETLLSSLRFAQIISVKASISPSISTGVGSPSNDGIGLPSHL